MADNRTGDMTVREAGERGGQKGGHTTAERYDSEHFSEIGQKGGERVSELVRKGKQSEDR